MFPLTVCYYYSLLHAGSLSSLNLSTGTLHPRCALGKRSCKDGNIWSPETAGAQPRWEITRSNTEATPRAKETWEGARVVPPEAGLNLGA